MPSNRPEKKGKGATGALLLSIDPGNSAIKFVTRDGQRRCITSAVKQLRPRESATPDQDSALLTFEDGCYIVGNTAAQMGAQPLYATDKTRYGHIAIAAAISLSTPPTDQPIKLRVLVPDATKDEWVKFGESLPKTLANFQSSEQVYFPQIAEVELISEGEPVFHYVRQRNLILERYQNKLTGVIDVGAGDLSGYLFSTTGDIIRTGGASFLADGFASVVGDLATAVDQHIKGSSDRAVLMELIKAGDYNYPTADGSFPFEALFNQVTSLWRKELAVSLMSDYWSSYSAQLGSIWIVGGGSPLLKSLEKAGGDRFRVLNIDGIDDPQVVNAYLLSQMA